MEKGIEPKISRKDFNKICKYLFENKNKKTVIKFNSIELKIIAETEKILKICKVISNSSEMFILGEYTYSNYKNNKYMSVRKKIEFICNKLLLNKKLQNYINESR